MGRSIRAVLGVRLAAVALTTQGRKASAQKSANVETLKKPQKEDQIGCVVVVVCLCVSGLVFFLHGGDVLDLSSVALTTQGRKASAQKSANVETVKKPQKEDQIGQATSRREPANSKETADIIRNETRDNHGTTMGRPWGAPFVPSWAFDWRLLPLRPGVVRPQPGNPPTLKH